MNLLALPSKLTVIGAFASSNSTLPATFEIPVRAPIRRPIRNSMIRRLNSDDLCHCLTPNAGTIDKNEISCSISPNRHCNHESVCFSNSTVLFGDWSSLCREVEKCPTDKFEMNLCDNWCNVPGKWDCGHPSLPASDERNPTNITYTCSCTGCNGCVPSSGVPTQVPTEIPTAPTEVPTPLPAKATTFSPSADPTELPTPQPSYDPTTPVERCSSNKYEQNFCGKWCNNIAHAWGCGVGTLLASDPLNTDNLDYNCDCTGCNGCGISGPSFGDVTPSPTMELASWSSREKFVFYRTTVFQILGILAPAGLLCAFLKYTYKKCKEGQPEEPPAAEEEKAQEEPPAIEELEAQESSIVLPAFRKSRSSHQQM